MFCNTNDKKKVYLVSVIVPVFNTKEYLVRCIESILNQTYFNIQLILVDDGSTDGSGELCDLYAEKDKRVIVIHQKNGGVSKARNIGLDNVLGEYYMFVDSDDVLMKFAVEFLVSHVDEYSANIVSAVKMYLKDNGETLSLYGDGKFQIYSDLDSLKLSLDYDRQTNSVCAKLFETKMFREIRFVDGRSVNEDGFYLFLCYAKKPVLVQHNVDIYQYYVRTDSSSRTEFSKKYLDMLYFSDMKKFFITEYYPELIDKADNMEVSTHLFFLEVLLRSKDVKYRDLENRSLKLIKNCYWKYQTNNAHEKRLSNIIYFGLWPIYKKMIRIKYYIKQ